jgi:predicted RNase H-like nuclease (RuvC/YqgF family)
MKTNLANIMAALSMAGLLASLSPVVMASEPVEAAVIRVAAEGATTQDDHDALAKLYEDAATELQAKVAETKELLEHYEDKSYLYGRRAQDLQSHTHALIRNYEKSVRKNLQAAAMHRQIAGRLKENHASAEASMPEALSGL